MRYPRLLWSLLCFTLVISLLAGPAFAVGDSGITDISITTTSSLSGQPASHELSFLATRDITATPNINVQYPSDFNLSNTRRPYGVFRQGQALRFFFFEPKPIRAGERVSLRIDGVLNPSTPGTYTLQLSIGSDPTKAPQQMPITATDGAVTRAWMDATNVLAGEIAGHAVAFTPTAGLPAGGTFRVEYPAGFDLSGATLQENDRGVALQEISGQTIVYRSIEGIPGGRIFKIPALTAGVLNPPFSRTYLLKISTDSDPTQVLVPLTIRSVGGSVTGASLQISSRIAAATTSYTVNFDPTSGLPEGSTVSIEFPEGFTPGNASQSDGRFTVESVTGQTVVLRLLKPVYATVFRPGLWYVLPEVKGGFTAAFQNVVNPTQPGSYYFKIWTSKDPNPVASPVRIDQPRLTINFEGAGGGSVNGDASCSKGEPCFPVSFPVQTKVTLIATPDAESVFGGWSGGCTVVSGNCEAVMDRHFIVTAAFHPAGKVRISNRPYDMLAAAFAESAPGTVEARATEFTERVTLTRPKVFKGGFDRDFLSNQGGFSVLKGSLTIAPGGRLIAEGLVIR